jgi:L-2-hydroxyglutarate oxidase LhgO
MEEVPLTIIGGGAVGLACAYELSDLLGPEKVFLLEKNLKVGNEQSGRSSEVLHSGLYQEGLRARLCVEGNRLLREFCSAHAVPTIDTGKLIVATNEVEDKVLDELLQKAARYGVPGLTKLTSKKEIQQLEPQIEAYSAIYSATTSIIDSATFVQRLSTLCTERKAYVLTGREVIDITSQEEGFILTVKTPSHIEPWFTRYLINSAGLYSDEIAKNVNPENKWEIIPVKGEFAVFYGKNECTVSRNVYPVPRYCERGGTKVLIPGVHLTPRVGDRAIRVGPAMGITESKEDYNSNVAISEYVREAQPFFPAITDVNLHQDQAGIMAEEKNCKDFIIEPDAKYSRCLHLVGIKSPGLTASLAIGKYVRRWHVLAKFGHNLFAPLQL